MAFDYPPLQEQLDRILPDIESRLPGVDPRMRRSLLGSRNHQVRSIGPPASVGPTTADAGILDEYATLYLEQGRICDRQREIHRQ